MLKPIALGLLAATAATLMVGVAASKPAAPKAKPALAHMVFFGLKDRSPESRAKFVASCEKYLTDHAGVSYFSVGTIAEDVEEPGVSVRDFDVALHVVFQDKAARDTYLVHPRHVAFVEENKPCFSKVRVFDTYLAPAKP